VALPKSITRISLELGTRRCRTLWLLAPVRGRAHGLQEGQAEQTEGGKEEGGGGGR